MFKKFISPMQDKEQLSPRSVPDEEPLRKRHILRDVAFIGAIQVPLFMYGCMYPNNKENSQILLAAAGGIYFLVSVALAALAASWGRQPKRLRRRRLLWVTLGLSLTWRIPALASPVFWLLALLMDFVMISIGLALSYRIAPPGDAADSGASDGTPEAER